MSSDDNCINRISSLRSPVKIHFEQFDFCEVLVFQANEFPKRRYKNEELRKGTQSRFANEGFANSQLRICKYICRI